VRLRTAQLVAGVTVLLALALSAAPVQAMEARIGEGAGWLVFPISYELLDSRRELVRGDVNDRGVCTFSGELRLAEDQEVVEVAQRAVNESRCETVIEIGTPPGWVLQAETREQDVACLGGGSEEGGVDLPLDSYVGTDLAPSLSLPGARQHSEGNLKSWLEDPACIDVTRVTNFIKWDWNGSRVWSNVTTGDATDSVGWYSGSGWQLTDHQQRGELVGAASYPTGAWSQTDAHFRNGIFCVGIDTHADYFKNTAAGWNNGDLSGKWHVKWYGGCANLLHFHKRLRRTYN